MKKQLYTVTVLDPSGATVEKRAFADSTDRAAERAIEMAKRTSRLPLKDRLYGAWKAAAVME